MVAGLGFHFLYEVQACYRYMSLIGNHLPTTLYIGGFGVMSAKTNCLSSLPEIILVFVLDKNTSCFVHFITRYSSTLYKWKKSFP